MTLRLDKVKTNRILRSHSGQDDLVCARAVLGRLTYRRRPLLFTSLRHRLLERDRSASPRTILETPIMRADKIHSLARAASASPKADWLAQKSPRARWLASSGRAQRLRMVFEKRGARWEAAESFSLSASSAEVVAALA
jgi:hypothetical protein